MGTTNRATGTSTGAANVADAGVADVMDAVDVAKVAAINSATAAAAVLTSSSAATVMPSATSSPDASSAPRSNSNRARTVPAVSNCGASSRALKFRSRQINYRRVSAGRSRNGIRVRNSNNLGRRCSQV